MGPLPERKATYGLVKEHLENISVYPILDIIRQRNSCRYSSI